jgi:hypothetical protein
LSQQESRARVLPAQGDWLADGTTGLVLSYLRVEFAGAFRVGVTEEIIATEPKQQPKRVRIKLTLDLPDQPSSMDQLEATIRKQITQQLPDALAHSKPVRKRRPRPPRQETSGEDNGQVVRPAGQSQAP